MAKMLMIGLTWEGSTSAELAGELTVDGHEVTVVIYRDGDENETLTGWLSPQVGLPAGWQATGGFSRSS